MKSTKTMLLLTFYLTTTQISIADDDSNQWKWFKRFKKTIFSTKKKEKQTEKNKKKEEEIPDQVGPEDFLTQFRYDLRLIPKEDIDEITNIAREELYPLCHPDFKDMDKINQILWRAIVTHVKNQTRIIAEKYTSNPYKIKYVTNSIGNNIVAILKSQSNKSMTLIDNKELPTFFGNKLNERIRKRFPFNENSHQTGNTHQQNQRSSKPQPPAPTHTN